MNKKFWTKTIVVIAVLAVCVLSFLLGIIFQKKNSIPLHYQYYYTQFQVASEDFNYTISSNGLKEIKTTYTITKTQKKFYEFDILYGEDQKQKIVINEYGLKGNFDNGYTTKADDNTHQLLIQVIAASFMMVDWTVENKFEAITKAEEFVENSIQHKDGSFIVQDKNHLIGLYADKGLYTFWIHLKRYS